MKVLQIINSHSNAVGGAERLSMGLHQGCLEKGVDSHLLCLMKAPSSRHNRTYSLGFNTPYHPLVLLRLIRFLRQGRWRDVDVIHVHLFPAQLLVALAMRIVGLRAACVTTEHNTFNRRRELPGAKRIDRFTYRFYQKIVCISEGTRQTMRHWLPEIEPKLVTIFNGIDLSRYVHLHQKSEVVGRKPIVLSAGRLTEQKNYAASIQAVKQLSDCSFEYWIAGQGELEGTLKEQANSLGLADTVRFLGFRDDLPELLARADIFLSPSKWEGFGLSVVEAMAAGLPVVVSDIPGVAEVVDKDSNSALWVDPLAPDEIAARLRELLQDPQLRAELGRNGRKRAACFDLSRMRDEYLRLYDEVRN